MLQRGNSILLSLCSFGRDVQLEGRANIRGCKQMQLGGGGGGGGGGECESLCIVTGRYFRVGIPMD